MCYNVTMQTINFRLKEILDERGMTIRGFSRDANLNRATINRIVHNQTRGITLDIIAKICDHLKIEPGDLFEKSKPEKLHRTIKK